MDIVSDNLEIPADLADTESEGVRLSEGDSTYSSNASAANVTTSTRVKPPVSLGLRIKELRIERGLQQKDLVEGEFSKAYISSVEAGRIQPSSRALEIIALRLSVSTSYLLGQESGDVQTLAVTLPSESEEYESDNEWEMLSIEIRVTIRRNPELARNLLIRKTRVRKLRVEQLKQYYYLMAECCFALNDLRGAQSDFEKACDLADKTGDIEMIARSSNQLGLVYYVQNRIVPALEAHRRAADAINRHEVNDPTFELSVYQNLANDFYSLGDQQQAFTQYRRAVDVAQQISERPRLAMAFWNLSQRYRDEGDIGQARHFADRALTIYEEMDELKISARVKANYGLILNERSDFNQAERYLTEALDLASQIGDPIAASLAAVNLSLVFQQAGNLDEELSYAEEGLRFAEDSDEALYTGQALARLATVHLSRNQAEQAAEYFERAVNALESVEAYDILGKVCFEYARTLSQLHRDKEAAILFEKAYLFQTGRSARR